MDPGSILVVKVLQRRRRLIMQYSWPGPVPPGGRQGTIRLIRCAGCGRPLYHTKTKGQPRQEDHERGCEVFITAMRVMRCVDELERSASESAAPWGRGRRRRRYLRGNARKLSVAACTSDPGCRAQNPWRPLSSRVQNAWQTSQDARKGGNGGNADAGLRAVGSRERSGANHKREQPGPKPMNSAVRCF